MLLRCLASVTRLLLLQRGPSQQTSNRLMMSAAATSPMVTTRLPGNLCVRDHILKVPVDHGAGPRRSGELELFVRELVPAAKADDDSLPCLLYLQGGPGFPSGRPTSPPSGWQQAALAVPYRVLLLDQRGTGRSSPITCASLSAMDGADAQAAFLEHFRADSIVQDCEIVRDKLAKGGKLTLLGQSFGGFCILSYLSRFPQSLEGCLFTFGLAPIGRSAEEVYRATFTRMEERNRRYYERCMRRASRERS